jgi:cell division protein FtsI (penicillin-binding protein 3)
MNDLHHKKLKQRRKTSLRKKSKMPLIILSICLFLSAGAIFLEKQQLDALVGIIKWFNQFDTQKALATSPAGHQRGNIYDRNYRSLAVSYKTYAVYARPLEMEQQNRAVDKLAEVLELDKNSLLLSLKKERSFVWLARGITQELAQNIENLGLQGIYHVAETNRFYPNQETAAQVVGFVENGQGLDGIEFQYDSVLRGDKINRKDLNQLTGNTMPELGKTGVHLVLSLDLMIQSIVERFLKKQIQRSGAAIGTALIMDANNGAILAMANYPSYNPNRYWDFSSADRKNYALSEPVYPDELRLIFQQAAFFAMQEQLPSQTPIPHTEITQVKTIFPKRSKKYRLSSAPRIAEVDQQYLVNFATQIGFSQATVIDIPQPENTASYSSYKLDDPSSSTSALLLLTAFTTAINGGKVVSPHLLKLAYDKKTGIGLDTPQMKETESALISQSTSKELLNFLNVKWLKRNNQKNSSASPMFFESHRMVSLNADGSDPEEKMKIEKITGNSLARVTQSVMLGAFPGDKPQLTMVLVLNYPESSEDVYPDMLDAAADGSSVLAPNQKTINKILHLANITPPSPSAEFWDSGVLKVGKNMTPGPEENKASVQSGHHLITMPDLKGKSLRGGLQVLQHYDLNIKLVGTGRIVAQNPPAGTFISSKSECTLEMSQEI